MTVFVDAQILVWAIFDRSRLNATAHSVLTNADNTLLVSEATLWELLNKVGRNKLLIAGSDIAVVHDLIQALGVTFVPIQRSHILQAASLPHHHSDPFDRILIAQAMQQTAPILTADSVIPNYAVETIW